jgi:hypothetical protein
VSGRSSAAFATSIGETVQAAALPVHDYLIDESRFVSEGNWAFCRFTGNEISAARLGFQKGGFNSSSSEQSPSPDHLQLHLELMTRDGAILWLPTGMYPAKTVTSDAHVMDIALLYNASDILRMRGWPCMACHFRSDDGHLEVDLRFAIKAVTVLPDCLLPYCTFAMWESFGDVDGVVRFGTQTRRVDGKVFFDHTRVLPRKNAVVARQMYVYTTMYFEDGSGLFGYYSRDVENAPISDYCFAVYIDAAERTYFLCHGVLEKLVVDRDGIAEQWRIVWSSDSLSVTVDSVAEVSQILRCWGSPVAPQRRKDFSIIPLVLRGSAAISTEGAARHLEGRGLAEHFDSSLWADNRQEQWQGALRDRSG